jgi:hypothetical protein
MATILNYVKPGDVSFDADVTHLMGEAFDNARAKLGHSQPKLVYELIAKRILDAARGGERNLEQLVQAALAGLLAN